MTKVGASIAIAMAAIVACAAAAFADDVNTIVQSGRAFHPGEVTIPHGTTLTFSNEDEFIHQVYVDSDAFKYDSEEQEPGQVLKITFPNAGTFPVKCHIHPKMLLIVHVK